MPPKPMPRYRLKSPTKITMGGKVVGGRGIITRKAGNMNRVSTGGAGRIATGRTGNVNSSTIAGRTGTMSSKRTAARMRALRWKINKAKGNIKKGASAALFIGALATSAAPIDKTVRSVTEPHFTQKHLSNAQHHTIPEVKSVSKRLTELNARENSRLKTFGNKNNKKKVYFLDEKQNKIVYVEMDAKRANIILNKQKANYGRLEEVIRRKVIELNKTAGPGEVFFWNGEKISNQKFNNVELRYVYKNLRPSEKAQLDKIYADLVKNLRTNNKFTLEVSKAMQEVSDSAKLRFLSRLTVDEFVTRFGNNPEIVNGLNRLTKSIETHNPNILPYVEKGAKFDVNATNVLLHFGSLGFGWYLLSLQPKYELYKRKILEIARKKKR